MNKLLLLFFFFSATFQQIVAQCNCKDHMTQSVYRLTLINPGFEAELAVLPNATLSIAAGVGYSGGELPYKYDNQTYASTFLISTYADIQFRRYYTLNKRLHNRKSIRNNSGNFLGLRSYLRGPELSSTYTRSANYDMIFGPIWGMQYTKGNFTFLFSTGPIVFTDFSGNYGWYPLNFDLNLGIVLSRRH